MQKTARAQGRRDRFEGVRSGWPRGRIDPKARIEVHFTRHLRGSDENAIVDQSFPQSLVEPRRPAASKQFREQEADDPGICDLDLPAANLAPRDVYHGGELERGVENELASRLSHSCALSL